MNEFLNVNKTRVKNKNYQLNYKQVLKNDINEFGCEITESTGLFIDKTVPTIFFIKCTSYVIQLSIFYKRGDYYWIGDDNTKKSKPKWFGDFPRGINEYFQCFVVI